MDTTIDFSLLKRLPISSDIENAQEKLELLIPNIIEENSIFFETN